jgi:hypothetical protein
MDLKHLLTAAARDGFFEPVIGMAPPSWPWALPHLYAANIAAETGDLVIGATADPTGGFSEETSRRSDLGRLEIIGFWRGDFHVIRSRTFAHLEGATQAAQYTFDGIPIRFLMESGRVTRENEKVDVTGVWPEHWVFANLRDLSVLCAFLYESAMSGGAGERAEQFRARLGTAYPATEQVLVYIDALKEGYFLLEPFVSKEAHAALAKGLLVARDWLR